MPKFMVGFKEGTSPSDIQAELDSLKKGGANVPAHDGSDLVTVEMPDSQYQTLLATKSATSKIDFIEPDSTVTTQ